MPLQPATRSPLAQARLSTAGRFRRQLAFVVIACVCTLILGAFLTCHDTRSESFYQTLSDAMSDGADIRGWIPSILPPSAHSIRDMHDLSPSRQWCVFAFAAEDADMFRTRLANAAVPVPTAIRIPNPHRYWWPKIFVGRLAVKKMRSAGYQTYYVVQSANIAAFPDLKDVTIYAVDWTKGIASYYRLITSSP